jgi:hypothetical protein
MITCLNDAMCVRPPGPGFHVGADQVRLRMRRVHDRPLLPAIVGWYTSTCKDASFVKQSRNMALRLRDHTDWPVRTAPSATSRPSR